MILRYKGYWVRIDKEEWKNLSVEEKFKAIRDYFTEEIKYLKEILQDYLTGYVSVHVQNIFCGDHDEIFHLDITCGRFGRGQYFSGIGRETAEKLVREWKNSKNRQYWLHVSLGSGAYQEYIFSRKQKDMLIEQLEPLLKEKWYNRKES